MIINTVKVKLFISIRVMLLILTILLLLPLPHQIKSKIHDLINIINVINRSIHITHNIFKCFENTKRKNKTFLYLKGKYDNKDSKRGS